MATRPYHHGNLREALIEAALKLLGEKGFRNLTLRNVAREAGVTASAMYRHYESKEALLAGVAEDGFQKLIQAGERELKRNTGDPAKVYQGLSSAYVGFAMEHPEQLRIMFSNAIEDRSQHPELQHTSSKSFQQLVDSVRDCQEQGLIKGQHDTLLVALSLWSMLHGLSMLVVERQIPGVTNNPRKTRALAQSMGRLVLEGLGNT